MPLAKSKNAVGLGNSLMNDRFGKGKGAERRKVTAGIQRTGPAGETYITNEKKEASWVKMRSVTEQAALDEFLSTAELAGTDFTAEKMNNVKVIHSDQRNPYLLSAQEERSAVKKQRANKDKLTVPRRPHWDETTTPQELDGKERASLLEWRRGLAEVQETADLLMTPFERNLEVWRQLWRVIERSDLVVQIVDARNPLLFRSEDLERYVKEVDSRKNNLLLVNKADMMTEAQRAVWADYFENAGINYKFFSAHLAKEQNEARELNSESGEDYSDEEDREDDDVDEVDVIEETGKISLDEDDRPQKDQVVEPIPHESFRTAILTVDELEALFLENSPDISDQDSTHSRKTQIGLVGYPNVGKSSTINALIGAKKVSVSSTPGKTKHFQTIHLSDSVILCDCPGLVFPNFATTKAELTCNGILPIDQIREYIGPTGLVAQRIPQPFYEAIYGVKVNIRPLEEGGTGIPTASEMLSSYAKARGFATTGLGQPDEARAARYVLKDYVSGKLLFCHPPPAEPPINPQSFNAELYSFANLPPKRQATLSSAHKQVDPISTTDSPPNNTLQPQARAQPSSLSRGVDKRFFTPNSSRNAGHYSTRPFNYKYSEQGKVELDSGKMLSGRKQRTLIALERGVDVADVRLGGKKHFKGGSKGKKGIKGKGDGGED